MYDTDNEAYVPLGVENGNIGASQMSGIFRWSSRGAGRYYSPDAGRLNFPQDGSRDPQMPGCGPTGTSVGKWLQVRLE